MSTETKRWARRPRRIDCRGGLLLIPLLVGGAPAASAGESRDVRAIIQTANEDFHAGRYKEARDAYAEAPEPTDPALLPDWLHNRAAAEFKLGDYATARDLWVRAASLRDPRFEAQTIFNLGNCSYQEALDLVRTPAAPLAGGDAAAAGTSIDKPIELLDHAIERYRDALRLDPSLTDARANLELADQLKKKLRESAQSQPQSQSQPSSQTQSQPGSQPSQQQNGQGEKQPSSQPQSQPQSQPSQDKQDQQGQNSDQDKEQNPQSQPQQNEDDQMPPESQPSEPQSRPASRPQSQPQPQPSPESQPSEGQAEQQPEQLMSQAEFERLLQKVRDAERLRRLKLRQAEAARQRPVEKDW